MHNSIRVNVTLRLELLKWLCLVPLHQRFHDGQDKRDMLMERNQTASLFRRHLPEYSRNKCIGICPPLYGFVAAFVQCLCIKLASGEVLTVPLIIDRSEHVLPPRVQAPYLVEVFPKHALVCALSGLRLSYHHTHTLAVGQYLTSKFATPSLKLLDAKQMLPESISNIPPCGSLSRDRKARALQKPMKPIAADLDMTDMTSKPFLVGIKLNSRRPLAYSHEASCDSSKWRRISNCKGITRCG